MKDNHRLCTRRTSNDRNDFGRKINVWENHMEVDTTKASAGVLALMHILKPNKRWKQGNFFENKAPSTKMWKIIFVDGAIELNTSVSSFFNDSASVSCVWGGDVGTGGAACFSSLLFTWYNSLPSCSYKVKVLSSYFFCSFSICSKFVSDATEGALTYNIRLFSPVCIKDSRGRVPIGSCLFLTLSLFLVLAHLFLWMVHVVLPQFPINLFR